jgi:hypothetical protein
MRKLHNEELQKLVLFTKHGGGQMKEDKMGQT